MLLNALFASLAVGLQTGWVWKRAKLVARDDDPERVSKLARIRFRFENLTQKAALVFADELDIHLLAKVGYQWMAKGEVVEILTPGQNQKRYLAVALDHLTGHVTSCVGERKTALLFIELLKALDRSYPAATYQRLYIATCKRPRDTPTRQSLERDEQ